MMKVILTAMILAGTGFSALAADGDFCTDVQCTPEMQAVAAEFQTYNHFPSEPMAVAYSGVCYMNEGGLDPKVEQHGMYLFETANGYTSGAGSHSYFAKTNPWEGQTFTQIRQYQEKLGTKLNPIIVTANQATLTFDYPDGKTPVKINHFFRTSGDELVMIWLTEWISPAGNKRIYCRLQRNPSDVP